MPDLSLPPAEKETTRLEAFSDGIFSVAITLLALEIAIAPHGHLTNAGLWRQLGSLWPLYLAYAASFVQILFMWLSHHTIFKLVQRSNQRLMLLNGLLLLLVVLVPFPTKTLGEFLATEARQAAILFYTGYFVLISLAFNLLTNAVVNRRHQLLLPSVTAEQGRALQKAQQLGLLFNSLSMVIALVQPLLALGLSTLLWIYWALLSRDQQSPALAGG